MMNMLQVGDVIEIGGQQASVCFHTNYNSRNYICVFFEEKKEYAIYDYKIENDKLMVAKVEEEKEFIDVLKIFLDEAIKEYGIPKNLNPIIDYLEKKLKEIKNT